MSRGRHGPDRVPARVDVASLVRDLRVRLRAQGVDDEHEPVAAIREGIEDHFEAVLLASHEILPDVVHDHARRVRVVARDADVDRVAVEDDADFGRFAGGLPFVRLGLNESVGRLGEPPRLFVERAVDDDRRARFLRANHAAAVGRLEL